jgi:hypothetical protein
MFRRMNKMVLHAGVVPMLEIGNYVFIASLNIQSTYKLSRYFC